jgi:sec-independent protein translocase protein TatB
MLFDLSMTELMLIGVVALVVIGPKDLPKALKVAGFWVRKARTLSREFQSSVEQMIREAELHEMQQELKKASEFDIDKEFRNTIDPTGSLAESLKPPELPRFSDADLPATPASAPQSEVPVMPQAIEGRAEVPTPPPVASAGPPQGGPPLPNPTVTAAEAGVQSNGESPAPLPPGFGGDEPESVAARGRLRGNDESGPS